MRVGAAVRRGLPGALAATVIGLAAPAAGIAAVKFTRVGAIPGLGGQVYGFVRSADGTLHIVHPASDNGAQGLTADAISPSGAIRTPTTALSTTWGVSVPGLVTLPNGSLEAFFGAIEPNTSDSSVWGITSSDGGTTWSAPLDVRSGPLENLAYASEIAASVNGTTPVLVIPQAGKVVVQQGLGQNTPTYNATNTTDGFGSDAHTAVDAGTAQVVASWDSGASGTGGDYIQTVAPSVGAPDKVPGQPRDYVVLAGRDKGPGVFGAYTTDDKHVRLLRYGGGTVAVGSLSAVTPAALGVATGIDRRIWVMWGSDNGNIAVTRSNKVTRFEPIQYLSEKIVTLFRLAGDGRLGPLDLLADQIADTNPLLPDGVYHARVLPELSAAVKVQTITGSKNKKKVVTSHTLTVTVTDAGDAVSGATVTIKGHTKKTSSKGVVKITLPVAGAGKVTVTVTAPTYQKLTTTARL
jgi:hypothetical protein